MHDRKSWVELISQAETQGWRVERTKGGHLRWVAPNGKVVFSAYSASDPRSLLNHKRQLRIAGFIQVKKKGK
jgi:predicted RNA binding protein YcfA (HicA-like mRNA interferase family)